MLTYNRIAIKPMYTICEQRLQRSLQEVIHTITPSTVPVYDKQSVAVVFFIPE